MSPDTLAFAAGSVFGALITLSILWSVVRVGGDD